MLHTQSILLPFFKQENLCCKVRMTLIFFLLRLHSLQVLLLFEWFALTSEVILQGLLYLFIPD